MTGLGNHTFQGYNYVVTQEGEFFKAEGTINGRVYTVIRLSAFTTHQFYQELIKRLQK